MFFFRAKKKWRAKHVNFFDTFQLKTYLFLCYIYWFGGMYLSIWVSDFKFIASSWCRTTRFSFISMVKQMVKNRLLLNNHRWWNYLLWYHATFLYVNAEIFLQVLHKLLFYLHPVNLGFQLILLLFAVNFSVELCTKSHLA